MSSKPFTEGRYRQAVGSDPPPEHSAYTQLSARSAIGDRLIKPGIKGSDPDRDQIMSRLAFRLPTAKQI